MAVSSPSTEQAYALMPLPPWAVVGAAQPTSHVPPRASRDPGAHDDPVATTLVPKLGGRVHATGVHRAEATLSESFAPAKHVTSMFEPLVGASPLAQPRVHLPLNRKQKACSVEYYKGLLCTCQCRTVCRQCVDRAREGGKRFLCRYIIPYVGVGDTRLA